MVLQLPGRKVTCQRQVAAVYGQLKPGIQTEALGSAIFDCWTTAGHCARIASGSHQLGPRSRTASCTPDGKSPQKANSCMRTERGCQFVRLYTLN